MTMKKIKVDDGHLEEIWEKGIMQEAKEAGVEGQHQNYDEGKV